jgi:hypothetical protein
MPTIVYGEFLADKCKYALRIYVDGYEIDSAIYANTYMGVVKRYKLPREVDPLDLKSLATETLYGSVLVTLKD